MVSEFLNLIDVPYFSHDCRHCSRKSCDKISKSTLFPSFVCLFIIVNVSRVVFCLLIFRCGLSVVTQSLPLHIHFPHGPPQNVVALSLPRFLRSSVYKTFPLLCFPNVRLFTFGRRRRCSATIFSCPRSTIIIRLRNKHEPATLFRFPGNH